MSALGGDCEHRLRLVRFAAITVFALVAVEALLLAIVVIPSSPQWRLGMDYGFYQDLGARWLADGSYYLPHQLAGPYEATLMVDVLYPPNALLLFVPFAILPAALWWILPVAVVGYVLWAMHPAPWAGLVVAVLLAWPRAVGAYLFGNTDIWAVAAVAAGLRWGWPAAFLALKPTLAPFMLVAVRRRTFWFTALGVAVVSLVMVPLWADYVIAMRNVSIRADYSLGSLPLLLVPVVAWLGRRAKSGVPPRVGVMDASTGRDLVPVMAAAPAHQNGRSAGVGASRIGSEEGIGSGDPGRRT